MTCRRRVVDYWTNVDAGLGARVAAGLGRAAASRVAWPLLAFGDHTKSRAC